MNDVVHGSDLTHREKRLLFWASFLSLTAAGFGFAFRVAMGPVYGPELELTNHEVGQIFGASLWPIAITMIGFSLVVDRTGYRWPMYGAFVLQGISGVGTYFASSFGTLYVFALCAGLGHGIVEAVINPVCAAVYPKEKTKWLTILHAAWPAGLVFGTLFIVWSGGEALGWRIHALWILLPAVAYALMYGPCKFPVDERVQAGVPYKEMLRQVGFLSAFLASFLIVYEIGNQVYKADKVSAPESWYWTSMVIGALIGLGFGVWVRSIGRPLFFLLCLLMIPVATAELGTDQWIRRLMEPVLEGHGLTAAYALVFSAGIMLILRVFAGSVLRFFSPPGLLCVSGLFSAAGLYWLSEAAGIAILVAFFLYALGQTYYWPCVLGFTSERYPQGGALTLNTVSAIGLLSAGIIGGQLLGIAFDRSIHEQASESAPGLVEVAEVRESFLGLEHNAVKPEAKNAYIAGLAASAEGGEQPPDVPEKHAEAEAAFLAGFDAGRADPGEHERVEEAYQAADKEAGRSVLAYAVRFPALLFVVFGLIALWFRSRGGYRPIELAGGSEL